MNGQRASTPVITGCTQFLLAACIALPAAALADDSEYIAAAKQFKAGKMSDAYGRFLELADQGDSDAARIVLFMYRFGPTLYGTHWDAAPQDLAYFSHIAVKHAGRPHPPFDPRQVVVAKAAAPKPKVRAQMHLQPVNAPRK